MQENLLPYQHIMQKKKCGLFAYEKKKKTAQGLTKKLVTFSLQGQSNLFIYPNS